MKSEIQSAWPTNLSKPTKIKKKYSISKLKGVRDTGYQESPPNRSDEIYSKLQQVKDEVWRKKMIRLNSKKP